MNSKLKNILIVLGLVTVGFAGYYMYVLRGETTLSLGDSTGGYESVLNRTQIFIEHSRELSAVTLEMSLFEDSRFYGLQSNSRPLQELESGRSNPFAPVGQTIE
jgi:hypothetical protein